MAAVTENLQQPAILSMSEGVKNVHKIYAYSKWLGAKLRNGIHAMRLLQINKVNIEKFIGPPT